MASCDTSEKVPQDLAGRVFYAAKYFGPTTVIAGVLVWQGIRMTSAMVEERKASEQYNRELTGQVVGALERSTSQSGDVEKAIERNTETLDEVKQILEKSIEH